MFGGERGDGAGRWGEGEREIMGRPVWGRGGRGVRADVGAGSTGGRGYDLYSVAIFVTAANCGCEPQIAAVISMNCRRLRQ